MVSRVIPVDDFDLVIFGATGDLAHRKILPGLYRRFKAGQFPATSQIIGAARTDQDDDAFRAEALRHYNISLGSGLSKVADKVFRIGHLGDINDLTLVGALSGVELALSKARVPHEKGGVAAAMEHLESTPAPGIDA